ncbi:MAG: hypothetical protein AAF065_03850 [Verrucomicrobiota bacterium]
MRLCSPSGPFPRAGLSAGAWVRGGCIDGMLWSATAVAALPEEAAKQNKRSFRIARQRR